MKSEVEAVLLFVAELSGSFIPGSGNTEDKIKAGAKSYISNELHELDLSDEDDRKDLHENMWLERLYAELDVYFRVPKSIENVAFIRTLSVNTTASYRKAGFKWSVPLELDASASMLQYMGLLLNDKRLMEMTNVIGETLQDPWKLEGMPRKMLKTAATPMLYGSAKVAHELWQDAGIEYTAEHVKLYSEEMAGGAFGVANLLKEFIINNATPRPEMEIRIWNDTFNINCNRFRYVGEKTKAYKAWDSVDKRFNIVLHTDTVKVPDLDRFKRYFMTLLIHNLDSQVMNVVMEKSMEKYGWAIPIHDAAIVSPAAAADVRKWYAEELYKIWENREQILSDYFKSIGITNAAKSQWEVLKSKVDQYEGDLVVNHMALK